ncbi:MAG TPA: LacI family DNA-binding transcriptional regulator [Marinilabiliaceae bacterium]|nr:LacI family DNA-binding transcriptional regulator [Marinilabiliaceae bacterium]
MGKVTTKDIAKVAGVSRTTVSYVLNNMDKNISQETRERVLRVAKELDYKPNPYAVGLKTKISKTIALVIRSISDPSLTAVIRGIQNASSFNKYSMILHCLDVKNRTLKNSIELLCERAIDGIILAYPDKKEQSIVRKLVVDRRIPTVIIGTKYPNLRVNRVSVDIYDSGLQMAEYMYGLGHRNIAIAWNHMTLNRTERIHGVVDFCERMKCRCFPIELQQDTDKSQGFQEIEYDFGKTVACHIVKKKLPVTSILMMSPWSAIGVINALRDLGKGVPEDYSVAAFAGYSVSQFGDPKLTMNYQMHFEIGRIACETLLSLLTTDNRDIIENRIFQSKIIVGETTREIRL